MTGHKVSAAPASHTRGPPLSPLPGDGRPLQGHSLGPSIQRWGLWAQQGLLPGSAGHWRPSLGVLEKPLEKKSGRNYGPPGTKKLIYFIDDMNMPEVDKYGTVAPHTLIRQHMDHGHWYRRLQGVGLQGAGLRGGACGGGATTRRGAGIEVFSFFCHRLGIAGGEVGAGAGPQCWSPRAGTTGRS